MNRKKTKLMLSYRTTCYRPLSPNRTNQQQKQRTTNDYTYISNTRLYVLGLFFTLYVRNIILKKFFLFYLSFSVLEFFAILQSEQILGRGLNPGPLDHRFHVLPLHYESGPLNVMCNNIYKAWSIAIIGHVAKLLLYIVHVDALDKHVRNVYIIWKIWNKYLVFKTLLRVHTL